VPLFEDHAPDYFDGVPLLHGTSAGVDLEPVGPALRSLVEALGRAELPAKLAGELKALGAWLAKDGGDDSRIPEWLFGGAAPGAPAPGLLRYLAWTVAARRLRPVVVAFDRWRDEERWMRNYCPTCGSPPAMAQLIGIDPARMRLLSCGACGSRWRYRRTHCPFCEDDSQRVSVLAIEGEARFRVDHCDACHGYLKAYLGEGDESLFLADWTSLHLDVIALDRGLERRASSLYELPPALMRGAAAAPVSPGSVA
jgi:FdhE protein